MAAVKVDIPFAFHELHFNDLNEVIEAGVYGVQASCNNIPSGTSYGFMLVIEYRRESGNHICQMFINHDLATNSASGTIGSIYYRGKNAGENGTWTKWKRISGTEIS